MDYFRIIIISPYAITKLQIIANKSNKYDSLVKKYMKYLYCNAAKLPVLFIFVTSLLTLIFGNNALAQILPSVKQELPAIKVVVKTNKKIKPPKPPSLIVTTEPFAKVKIGDHDPRRKKIKEQIADKGGLVYFYDLIWGKYKIFVELEGYESQIQEGVLIDPNKINSISMNLRRLSYTFDIKANIQSGEVRYVPVELVGLNPDGSQKAKYTGPYTIAFIANGVARIDILKAGYYNIEVRPSDNTTHFPTLKVLKIPEDLPEGTDDEQPPFLRVDLQEMPKTATANNQIEGIGPSKKFTAKIDFGKYYALIIGNNDYQNNIPKLKNAVNDAKAVEAILKEKYGFETKLLLDAKGQEITAAINNYRRTLTENDNLLIYYSGHGQRDADETYWIPVDATDDQDNTTWVSSTVHVINNFKSTKAKHILVISDSCFAGTIDYKQLVHSELETKVKTERDRYLIKNNESKSRILIASGGNEPVVDGDGSGGKHSIFTKKLLDGLEKMGDDPFTAAELYSNFIEQQVSGNAKQTPVLKLLSNSGHDNGYFIFVRKP